MSINSNGTGLDVVGIGGGLSAILKECDEAMIYCVARKDGEVVTFGANIDNTGDHREVKPFVSCIDTKQSVASKIYEKLACNIGQMEVGFKAISTVLETEATKA